MLNATGDTELSEFWATEFKELGRWVSEVPKNL